MLSRYIESGELSKIREAAGPDWLPLSVALLSGLRVGDVVKMRRADVRAGGVYYVAQKTGKAGFSRLPDKVCAQLRDGPGAWCFPSPKRRGEHLTRQAVWQRLKRAAKKAGVDPEGVSPHALRKVYAVEHLKTEGIEAVQAALQHDRKNVTEIYALSDWLTGENAEKPLLRRDLMAIATKIADLLRNG